MNARLCLVLPGLMAGCVSVLPEPVVPEGLYRLTSISRQMPEGGEIFLPGSVMINPPQGSDLLLGRSIVFEEPNGALKLLASAEWSDQMARQLQGALIDRLMFSAAEDSGAVLSDRFGAGGDYELQWEVRDMVIRDTEAVIQLRGTLSRFQNGKSQSFNIQLREPYVGMSDDAGVQALIDVARKAIDELATTVPELMNRPGMLPEDS